MEEKKRNLNPREKRFCQLYAGGGEFCGNGVWSYIVANDLTNIIPLVSYSNLNETEKKAYNTAKAMAAKWLTRRNISQQCDKILDKLIRDDVVDRELARVIMQNDELSAKVAAIREYNLLKSRITAKSDIKLSTPLKIQIVEYAKDNSSNQL